MSKQKTIFITAGGTGGHLFPAETLARGLMAQDYQIVFITDKRGVAYQTLAPAATVKQVCSATFGGGIVGKIAPMFKIGIGILQSMALIIKHRPKAIVGFGGYPSFPAMFAGTILRVPTILHEQNAVLGKANAFLAKFARKIGLSHKETADLPAPIAAKSVFTGNPIRDDIAEIANSPYPEITDDNKINLFIMGGSQGAHSFSDIIPKAIIALPDDLKKRLHITQQCRPEDIEDVTKAYADHKISANLQSFFDNVPMLFKQCHFFIGRSGASTVSEVTVIGRPSLFVPLMSHADQQQRRNAQAMVDGGAAQMMLPDYFTAEKLCTLLSDHLSNPDKLQKMATDIQEYGRLDAKDALVDLVLSITAPDMTTKQAPTAEAS